ncbi:MAG: hypothetical protein KDC98_03875 [Planctomycetes bacterium]|nr:hypothetical protein [Planctomycetota bacterium]
MTMPLRPCGALRFALATATLFVPLIATAGLSAQAATGTQKRALTHDDYDSWPSLRSTTYSHDGNWMAYAINPRVGDGVLYIRQVDGDKVYTFDRGQSVTFSNDNKLAFFKVDKSYADERQQKLTKLYEKKEEKKSEGATEETELPPDIKAAIAERGMPEAMVLRMIEQRGSTMNEVRGFLGLPEVEAKAAPKKPQEKPKKSKEEEAAEKELKALQKRVHVLDLTSGEVTSIENVKSYRQPQDSDLLVLHFEKPEPEKKKDEDKGDEEK